MLNVPLDSKFTPLLNRLARMPAGGPIPLAVGAAFQNSVLPAAGGTAPKASSVGWMGNVASNGAPPATPAPIVMSDFLRAALASAQKQQARPPGAPNPAAWPQQAVYPSADLLALLRAARKVPTGPFTSGYFAGQAGPAKTGPGDAGSVRPVSLLKLAFGNNARIPQAPAGRPGAGRGRIDVQKANDTVNLAGETVEMLGKAFPEFGLPIEGLGEIIDVAAIITSGFGIADALQRGDRRALIGCTLTAGASVLGLIGALSGDTSLATAGMIVKWSKSGWSYVFPSEPPAKTPLPIPAWTPPRPLPASTPLWPGLVPTSPWPGLGATPRWPTPASTPPWPGLGSTSPWPLLGSTPPKPAPGSWLGAAGWTYDPVSGAWKPPGG